MNWQIEEEKLSDGSIAYNLVGINLRRGNPVIRFGCVDKIHAEQLLPLLNRLAWAEVIE